MYNGNLKGAITQQVLHSLNQSSTEATLYNGSVVAVTGNGFDTTNYDEMLVYCVTGSSHTGAIKVDFVHSDTNDPATAIQIVSLAPMSPTQYGQSASTAAFGTITSASAIGVGSLRSKNACKRYMWSRVYQTATTCQFFIYAIAGASDKKPLNTLIGTNLVFDAGY